MLKEQLLTTVGIITALPQEYNAIKSMLEEHRDFVAPGRGAGHRYRLAEVRAAGGGAHHIAIALADMGNNSAAVRASLLLADFPNVQSIIMVGIAGGVPNPSKADEHVRLGDIVVSDYRGVVQYDFDKETAIEIIHRHPPRPPSATLLEAIRLLEAEEEGESRPWQKFIDDAVRTRRVGRPPAKTDILVDSADPSRILVHPKDPQRRKGKPRVFKGPIASANKLLKNPIKRDQLRDRFGVKAVEMESSGIADATWYHEVGYLAIRGICDYCDSNKGDAWQKYAAFAAAAYTMALLESMPSQDSGSTAPDASTQLPNTTRRGNLTIPPDQEGAVMNLLEEVARMLGILFPDEASIAGLVGLALGYRLPTSVLQSSDPETIFRMILAHSLRDSVGAMDNLINRAIELRPHAGELKVMRARLADFGLATGRLDETIPGGRYLVEGRYVDAWKNSVDPPPVFPVLDFGDTELSDSHVSSGSSGQHQIRESPEESMKRPAALLYQGDTSSPLAEDTSRSLTELRHLLARHFDDPGLDALCMDNFPQVYDSFARGLRRDEKITLLMDYCRRNPESLQQLEQLLDSR